MPKQALLTISVMPAYSSKNLIFGPSAPPMPPISSLLEVPILISHVPMTLTVMTHGLLITLRSIANLLGEESTNSHVLTEAATFLTRLDLALHPVQVVIVSFSAGSGVSSRSHLPDAPVHSRVAPPPSSRTDPAFAVPVSALELD